ncbi:hypothetical protein GCM10010156_45720 [Planobispora rosea]|uniref:Uncharacterized protein n=1 Tax=Planobispora rosea TaxID=35762 RepID=A0A8J3S4R0_PLARO|nr:hypothetical protein [Planobispora rosea]GGS81848.1 hypothetical protein GCM10010156_45720 [Planobispora rosea]GIH86095.1 hypothetical protein Pro02_45030 [Planobispora rosea]
MLPIALVLAPIALILVPAVTDQVEPGQIKRFVRRQGLVPTPANGDLILTYLRVTRRWRALGLIFGALVALASEPLFTIRLLFPVLGWFAGALVAEVRLARARPAGRKDIGVRLVPPAVTWLWGVSAVVAGALAVSGLARFLLVGADAATPLWALAAAATVPAVTLLTRGLRTRPLPLGPAGRDALEAAARSRSTHVPLDGPVAAEIAARSRSAHVLLTGGSVAALWCGLGTLGTEPEHLPDGLVRMLVLAGWVVLPLVALALGTRSWRPVPRPAPGRRPAVAAAVTAVSVAVALGAALTWSATVPSPAGKPVAWSAGDEVNISSQPIAYATLPKCGARRTVRDCAAWDLLPADRPGYPIWFPQAAAFAGRWGPLRRPAPFALSGDGFHVVYLHARTRRMVHHDLRTGARRDLTGPLPDTDLPMPVLSYDGRYVTLTPATGPGTTRLVDTGDGRSVEVPGLARVLGVGPRGLAAVTVPEADKPELVTVDLRGTVRTRTPFDPASVTSPFPDGRRLLVLTEGGAAVTVDPATGRTVRRVKIKLKLTPYGDPPEFLGWSGDGRFLARLSPEEPGDGELRLVDPATGRVAEPRDSGPVEDARKTVIGKVSAE